MKQWHELRYKVKLTPLSKTKKGVTTLLLEPFDVEGNWDITGPSGHIILKLCGSHIKGTLDDVIIIDMEKNIGLAEAREFKQEIAGLYLSGKVDIDSKGEIVQIHGDVPFVEFWTEAHEYQIGFFGIVFPDNPIPIAGTWTEGKSLKKLGDTLLADPGVRATVSFTRQIDTTIYGRKINVFTAESSFNMKDIVGYMDQQGQRIRLNIPTFERSASGTIHFDAEKGVLIDSNWKAVGKGSMNFIAEGQTVRIDMTIDAIIKMRL